MRCKYADHKIKAVKAGGTDRKVTARKVTNRSAKAADKVARRTTRVAARAAKSGTRSTSSLTKSKKSGGKK